MSSWNDGLCAPTTCRRRFRCRHEKWQFFHGRQRQYVTGDSLPEVCFQNLRGARDEGGRARDNQHCFRHAAQQVGPAAVANAQQDRHSSPLWFGR